MSAFRFRLDKALQLRRTQWDIEEMHFREQLESARRLDETRAQLTAKRARAEAELRQRSAVDSGDLTALSGFHLLLADRHRRLAAERAEAARLLAERRSAVLEARRRFRLLERLRERRLAEWKAAEERQIEAFAGEAYLARWRPAKVARPEPRF